LFLHERGVPFVDANRRHARTLDARHRARDTGGNFRDWQLMTATTTQKTPKQLRFVEQDVDLPSPFVIGDSLRETGEVVLYRRLADSSRSFRGQSRSRPPLQRV